MPVPWMTIVDAYARRTTVRREQREIGPIVKVTKTDEEWKKLLRRLPIKCSGMKTLSVRLPARCTRITSRASTIVPL